MMTRTCRLFIATAAVMMLLGGHLLAATNSPWSAGYRVELLTANGNPANDLMGSGAFLRYWINPRYQAEVAFEYVEYDFESPQQHLGIPASTDQDPEARTRLNLVSFRFERMWRQAGIRIRPFAFLGMGLGYAVIDDIQGTAGDRDYDVKSEGGLESVPACGMGIRYQHNRWMVDGGVKVERHLANWKLEDRMSGGTVELGDYTVWGGWIGLGVLL